MEKNVENEMETGAIKGRFRDPSLSIKPRLSPTSSWIVPTIGLCVGYCPHPVTVYIRGSY